MDLNDHLAVLLVEGNSVDSVEKFLEIALNSVGVGTLGQNLKQIVRGTEVKAGENSSLLSELRVELLLALLEVHLHLAEGRLEEFVLAAGNNILGLESTLHVLKPDLVDGFEELGFSWQVLGNITGSENGNQVGPESLNFKPLLDDISDVGKESNSVSDLSLERSHVLHGVHLIQLIKMFFELLLNVHDVATKGARLVNTLPGLDLELSFLPVGNNFLLESLLELELLVGGLSDFLDFFSELEEGALEKLLQGEGLG